MAISMIDTGFFNFITHKYVRFTPFHYRFPSLVFLYNYGPTNTLLQYLLLKNMNFLAGNRAYRLNQHQHLHFVVNLYLRISPPCPAPAVPPLIEKIRCLRETIQHLLLSQTVTDRFYQAVFPQFYTLDHRFRLPGPGTAGFYLDTAPQHAAAGFYPTPPVFTEFRHAGHVYHYREPGHNLEKREIIPGPPAWEIQSSKTVNMFINENRELLKKIRTVVNRYHISRERHTQTLMVKQTDSLIKPVGDVLFIQSQTFESSQPGTFTYDNKLSPGDDENSHRRHRDPKAYPHSPYSPIFMAAPHDAAGLDRGRMKIMHSISQFYWRGLIYQARPQAIHPLGLMNQTPTIGFILRRAANFTAGEFYPSQSVYNGESRFPSPTSPVISNITSKYTSSPGDIPTFSPTASVPDLYYSSSMKGVERDLEESRTVTGSIKGVKSPEEAGPGPVKFFGQEHPGVSKKTLVDLDRLTDQVFQKLERKIIIEKERRGW